MSWTTLWSNFADGTIHDNADRGAIHDTRILFAGSKGFIGMELQAIREIVARHRHRPGAMLPILHEIQQVGGHLPATAIAIIAEALNVSRAEVYGVITFYADFRTEPPGRSIIQVCRGEACQAKGGCELEEHAKRSLGIDFHQTTTDDAVTLEPVFCLGNCACSPSVRVGDEVHGRVDATRFDELVAEAKASSGVGP
ncbi:MAG: formate dehydrogenase subunit gamma [Planctomycetaceae bacterium]|nr:formate dehydrogenase subunit gamma [Planctomycetaceae bacterium]